MQVVYRKNFPILVSGHKLDLSPQNSQFEYEKRANIDGISIS